MSAIASITVNDAQATPVAHVFTPVSSTPPYYREAGAADTPVIGESEIMLSLRRSDNNSDINKVRISMNLPVLEEPSGSTGSGYVAAPKLAYFLKANLEILLPNRCTQEQRADIRVMLANLLNDTQIEDLVDSLQVPY